MRHSFDAVRDQARPVALLFYGRLFELDPPAQRLFTSSRGAGAKSSMLATLIESLDRFESIRPQLPDLGRQHAGYGVRLEQYDTVSAALI